MFVMRCVTGSVRGASVRDLFTVKLVSTAWGGTGTFRSGSLARRVAAMPCSGSMVQGGGGGGSRSVPIRGFGVQAWYHGPQDRALQRRSFGRDADAEEGDFAVIRRRRLRMNKHSRVDASHFVLPPSLPYMDTEQRKGLRIGKSSCKAYNSCVIHGEVETGVQRVSERGGSYGQQSDGRTFVCDVLPRVRPSVPLMSVSSC